MTDGTRVTVEGEAAFRASLGRVADQLDNLPGAASEAGRTVAARAAQGAPVDTGALAASIAAAVMGGDAIITAGAPYAVFQEYGTAYMAAHPYMRPALDESTAAILDAYAAEIQQLLETVKGA